jgi:DNA mismatch endonuclease (patch repair protein)
LPLETSRQEIETLPPNNEDSTAIQLQAARQPPCGQSSVCGNEIAMADHVGRKKRSEIMRAVPSKHTSPELVVRRVARQAALRYRLHDPKLPGRPDLVIPKTRTVVFVNGCFWHRHGNCPKASSPKTNKAFWNDKFSRNIERDRVNYSKLRKLGWKVVVIWQCQTRSTQLIARKLGISSRNPL